MAEKFGVPISFIGKMDAKEVDEWEIYLIAKQELEAEQYEKSKKERKRTAKEINGR